MHRLGARGDIELAEEVARVGLGRRLADAQAPGHLLETQAPSRLSSSSRSRAVSATAAARGTSRSSNGVSAGLLGRAQLVRQRSDAQGSSSKTSMTS